MSEYNALDVPKKAREVRELLTLELADWLATLEYNRATDSTHNQDDEIAYEYGRKKIADLQKAITAYLVWSDGDFPNEH